MDLGRLESALERALDGAFARLVRARLHPIEIFRALWRVLEDGAARSAQATYVPNRLTAWIAPEDFAEMAGLREQLEGEFRSNLQDGANENAWRYGAMILVRLAPSEKVRRGQVRAEAALAEEPVPAALMAENGSAAGQQFAFDGRAVIGRSADCDVILPDATVSRRHCRFDWTFEGYQLTDLDSSNGTLVNGVEVTQYVPQSGDVLTLGDVRLRFRYDTQGAWEDAG